MNININWFAIVIVSFWFFAYLASIINKDTKPFGYFLY